MASNTTIPSDVNFAIIRGDAASWTLTVTFPPGSVSNNLNNYALAMTAKNNFVDLDANAVFSLTKANGRITVDGVNSAVAHITLTPADTAGIACPPPLSRTILVYDVQIEGIDNRPYTVSRGTLTVVADTTRFAT